MSKKCSLFSFGSALDDRMPVELFLQAITCCFVARLHEAYPYSPMKDARSGKGAAQWDAYLDVLGDGT